MEEVARGIVGPDLVGADAGGFGAISRQYFRLGRWCGCLTSIWLAIGTRDGHLARWLRKPHLIPKSLTRQSGVKPILF